jgi:glycosyltransferase involved in cell wall biosynthesis
MRASSGITVQLDSYKYRYPKYLQDRIKVIYNEILVTPTIPTANTNGRPFTFGFVGRFSYQKQPLNLINSFARHAAEGNDSRLIFFGRGELEPEMRKRISDLELDERVRIFEPLQDLDQIYDSLDALCIPSLWEGFPNVAGEAMLYGIPILGNQNCLGLSELVSPRTGCLVDFESNSTDCFKTMRNFVSSNGDIYRETTKQIEKFQKFDFAQLWDEVVKSATRR